jgi:predicted ribonuclease YlaK
MNSLTYGVARFKDVATVEDVTLRNGERSKLAELTAPQCSWRGC